MALTRAQLLMGDSGNGAIISGQPQGVRPGGAGITIGTDGVISVNSSTIVGVMKLNTPGAYNSYFWPGTDGAAGTQLQTDGAGNLSWADPDGIAWTAKGQLVVGTGAGSGAQTLLNAGSNRFVLKANSTTASGLQWTTAVGLEAAYTQSATPTSPIDGQLWYDCTTGYFKVYQSCVSPNGWTSVAEAGLPIDPATQVSAAPAFASGAGTSANPYITAATSVGPGTSAFVVNTVTVTGLAPFQYVPIYDLNVLANGGRFTFSNNYADAAGTLIFQIIYIDLPTSAPATTYTAQIKVGYGSAYIDATVNIVSPFTITDPGNISGSPNPGYTLSYSAGTFTGGVAPVVTSWNWRRASDNALLQANGNSYIVPSTLVGDRVYVEFICSDSISRVLTDDTTNYPAAPAVIQFANFPLTVFSPSTGPNASPASVNSGGLNGTASGTWADGSTNLTSTGSLQFRVNAGGFGQGPTLVNDTDTVSIIWSPAAVAAAADGATLSGCLGNGVFQNCYSMTVSRSPNPFAFGNLTTQALLTAIASNVIYPAGFNVPISFWQTSAGTTLTSNKVAIGGGALTNIPTTLVTGLVVNPGDSLQVQGITGIATSTSYLLNLNLGASSGAATSTWDVQTTSVAPSVVQPSIATPTNGSTGIATTINVTGTAYSAAGGAGPQASADWRIARGDLIVTPTSAITKVVGPAPWSTYLSSPSGFGCCGATVGPFSVPAYSVCTACTNSSNSNDIYFSPTGVGQIPIVPSDTVSVNAVTGCPSTAQIFGGNNINNSAVPAVWTGLTGTIASGTPIRLTKSPCGANNTTQLLFIKINGVQLVENICNVYFTDATSLAGMAAGDTLKMTGGGAEGTIFAVDVANKCVQVSMTSGTFVPGNTAFDMNVGTYPPAPTSWPPGAGYTVITNVTGDTVNLTTFPLAGLSAASRFYAQVQYNSATIPTSSGFSAWSSFTTA